MSQARATSPETTAAMSPASSSSTAGGRLPDAPPGTTGLATRLRRETADAHRAAERTVFVQDLLAGRLARADYARLARQLVEIYAALERLESANTEPSLATFLLPGLHRTAALHSDLAALAGAGWTNEIAVLASTRAYCDRIVDAVDEFAGLLLAHHYVRYLGDLSGGRMIGRVLERSYGRHATAYYRFDAIADADAVKRHYRTALDALRWDTARQQRLIDEVTEAYRHHATIFGELTARPNAPTEPAPIGR